jgi:hypothetical protein
MDQEFETKFQNLYDNIAEQFTKEKETFDEMEKLMQKKYSEFVMKLNGKVEDKCKDKVENLILYSEYQKNTNANLNSNTYNSNSLNKSNPVPLPGYEKEYNDAMYNLTECADKYYSISDELYNITGIINNIVLNSSQSCLRECKNDIFKNKHSEYEAGKCIQSCVRYRNFNLNAHFKLIFETIDEFQRMADKL